MWNFCPDLLHSIAFSQNCKCHWPKNFANQKLIVWNSNLYFYIYMKRSGQFLKNLLMPPWKYEKIIMIWLMLLWIVLFSLCHNQVIIKMYVTVKIWKYFHHVLSNLSPYFCQITIKIIQVKSSCFLTCAPCLFLQS